MNFSTIVKGKHQIIMKMINVDICSCFRDPVSGGTDIGTILFPLQSRLMLSIFDDFFSKSFCYRPLPEKHIGCAGTAVNGTGTGECDHPLTPRSRG